MFDEYYDIHYMESFVDQGGTLLWIFLHWECLEGGL